MTKDHHLFDRQYRIFAGKFRRYNGESSLKRVFDIKTNLLNLRDFFFVSIGFVQSVAILIRVRPNVVLLKGGFVGVPVGFAAALLRIPFITHDSDAMPGLANRLVGRWAKLHATGLPVENYQYPKSRARFVGVLVSSSHELVTSDQQAAYKKELGIPKDALVLLITGGSLGAASINKAMVHIAPKLLKAHPKLWIIHQAGKGKSKCYGVFSDARLKVLELMSPLHQYTGAADVVVTRAGANTLAELGVQAKASIVVPNPLLTGGHQLKNAQVLADESAVLVVDESTLAKDTGETLQTTIEKLLSSASQRKKLGMKFHRVTPHDATAKLADLIIKTAQGAGE